MPGACWLLSERALGHPSCQWLRPQTPGSGPVGITSGMEAPQVQARGQAVRVTWKSPQSAATAGAGIRAWRRCGGVTADPHSPGEGGHEGDTTGPLCTPIRASGKLRLTREVICSHPEPACRSRDSVGCPVAFPSSGVLGLRPAQVPAPRLGEGEAGCLWGSFLWGLREPLGASQIPPPPTGLVRHRPWRPTTEAPTQGRPAASESGTSRLSALASHQPAGDLAGSPGGNGLSQRGATWNPVGTQCRPAFILSLCGEPGGLGHPRSTQLQDTRGAFCLHDEGW